MKYIHLLLFFVIPIISYAQSKPIDSVSVRVFNRGKFYLKQYSIIIGDKKYIFEDVSKGKHSDYKKLPYVYSANWIEVQIVRKRFLQYDEWIKKLMIPIDHIGDKRMDSGTATITVSTKRKHRQLMIESTLK